MKHNNRDRFELGLLKGLFEQSLGDLWISGVDLVEYFHFLGAQAGETAFAPEPFGKGCGELLEGPQVPAVNLAEVAAPL